MSQRLQHTAVAKGASPTDNKRIDSLLGGDAHVEGDISFAGGLRMDGQIHGSVSATGLVALHPSARLAGDLHHGAIEMRPGAVIEGQLFKLPTAAH